MAGRRSPLPAENYAKSVCSLLVSFAASRDGVTKCSPRRGGSIAWLRAKRLWRILVLCIIVLSGSKIKTTSLNLPFFKFNPCKKVIRRGSGITIRKISLGRFIPETQNWTEPSFMLFKWHFLTICQMVSYENGIGKPCNTEFIELKCVTTSLYWFSVQIALYTLLRLFPPYLPPNYQAGGSLRAGHRANWPTVNTTLPGCFTSQRTSFYYTERSKTVLSYNSALFLMSLIECKTYFAVQFPL